MRTLFLVLALAVAGARARADDPLREAAERALLRDASELRRVCALTVRLRDPDGRPLAGIPVEALIPSPSFALGAEVRPGFPEAGGPGLSPFRRHFSRALLKDGLYWRQWEGPQATVEARDLRTGLAMLREAGIPVLGHALVWPGWHRKNPPGLSALAPEVLQRAIVGHVSRITGVLRRDIADWDVVTQPRVDRDFLDRLGEPAAAAWFTAAQAAAPGARLGFSEFGLLAASAAAVEETLARVETWRAAGARPSVLRIHTAPVPQYELPRVRENLSRLAGSGLDLEITGAGPVPSDGAEEVSDWRRLMVVLLAHPSVRAVYLNDTWDTDAPALASFLEDLALAPPARHSGVTDAQGKWAARVPRGDVQLTLKPASGPHLHSLTLARPAQDVEIEVRPGEKASPSPPTPEPAVALRPSVPAISPPRAKPAAIATPSAARVRAEAQWHQENPPPPPGPLNLDRVRAAKP